MEDLQRSNSNQNSPLPPYEEVPSSDQASASPSVAVNNLGSPINGVIAHNSSSIIITPTGQADRPFIVYMSADGENAWSAADSDAVHSFLRELEPAHVRNSPSRDQTPIQPHHQQYESTSAMTTSRNDSQNEATSPSGEQTRRCPSCSNVVANSKYACAVSLYY